MSEEFTGQLELGELVGEEFVLSSLKRNTKADEDSESITLSQRMMSACAGSFVTSLVVTPFDVVRVRIQQQEILPKNDGCCNVPVESNIKKPSNRPMSNLFWVSHHYCSNNTSCTKVNSTFQGFFVISKNEGLATLWRGLSLTLLMSIPSNVIYFGGYEYAKEISPFIDHPANPFLCGSFARLLAASFVSPFELIKTRLQSIPAKGGKSGNVLKMLVHDTLSTVKVGGIKTLYTGLQITLWRDVPFSGIYWFSYETLKTKITQLIEAQKSRNAFSSGEKSEVFMTSFLAGSISGTIGAVATHPFDVGKTRLQIVSETSRDKGAKIKGPSMFNFLKKIYKSEGYRALYVGMAPRILKVAPSCAIMISSYEIGKKFFKKLT